jgi:hypothetical protein
MSNRKHVIVEDSSFVPEKIVQVIEAIRQYNHELDVEWIPPRARKPGEAAFRIMHKPLGKEPYVIFHVKTEDEFDARVLKRIIHGDASVNGMPRYSELEAAEEAAKRVAHQQWLDELEEKNEMAHALLKTDKTVYKFNDDLIFHADKPGNRAKDYKPKVL